MDDLDHFVDILVGFRYLFEDAVAALTAHEHSSGLELFLLGLCITPLFGGGAAEEAARSVGASRGTVSRKITLPLIRPGLIGSWLLVFMIFEREYSTGVYLLAPGTEVIGAQLVSLWQGGAIDIVAALSLINILLVGVGLAVALRLGVKLRD